MASEDPTRQDAAAAGAASRKAGSARGASKSSIASPPAAHDTPVEAEIVTPAAVSAGATEVTTPADIEAAVARLTPPASGDAPAAAAPAEQSEPEPAPVEEKAPEPRPASAVVRREGPSPWLALPIGAIAGALAAGAVAYGLVETGTLSPVPGGDLQPLFQRVSALEQRPRQDLAPSVAQLDSRVAQLEAAAGGLAGLRQDFSALKQNVDALTASASQSAALAQQAAGLSGQVAALTKKVDDLSTSSAALDRGLASVVALGALREAVQAGRPFAPELDAARRALGSSSGALDAMAPAAAQGYPVPNRLADRLLEAARAKPGASAPSAPSPAPAPAAQNSGLMDRLLSSAESLVRVGSTETGPGPDDQAALDGAAAALRMGDGVQAVSRLDALSPEIKAKVKPVLAEITARRDALATLATLNQQALAAISGKLP